MQYEEIIDAEDAHFLEATRVSQVCQTFPKILCPILLLTSDWVPMETVCAAALPS